MRNNILFSVFLFFIFLTLYSLNIPFFWDGTFFSELSVFFYENGYNGFIAPQQIDTGGFPLFSVYITAMWKIFGKTLAISHLAILPLLPGIAYEYYKLAKQFLNETILSIAMLLLIAEPTFITQCMLMGYDILMIYFFLLTLNALLSNKQLLFSIAITLLCISNVRGMVLGGSVFIIDILINKKLNFNTIKKYVLAFLILLIWFFYHKQHTGWLFFSPERENTHEAIVPLSMMFHQLIFICWKLADFGRVTLWLFLFIGICILYKKKTVSVDFKKLLLIIFIPILLTCIVMIQLANPIAHRYFIFAFLPLIIGACYMLQQIANKKIIYGLTVVFITIMISGNFWLYPERYGNGWDASLKVIPYFSIKEQMDEHINTNNINPNEVGTQFPLIADKRFSHLTDTSYHYKNVWAGPLDDYKYFLHSNVINTDIPEQIEAMKNEWELLKEFRSGQVYLQLYKNKNYIHQ
ncbi:MAG: hypothetical protein ACT4ON_01420 [Bacteroidota bacterium]